MARFSQIRCAVRVGLLATSFSMLAMFTEQSEVEAAAPAIQSEAKARPKSIDAKLTAGKKPDVVESIESLVKRALPSIVIIRGAGRDGKESGLGTGFVIDSAGLVATNLHVIGEGRAVSVETHDGKKLEVTAVYASKRVVDLAVLRVAAKDLPKLSLGDSDGVVAGQDIVVLGNPQGLAHSVVKGVASGSREIDGMPLIQLAVPIEPGNSGGPVLDTRGRVLGIVTMKSAVTDNLGFAVKVNALKDLLEQPNTVTMDRWLTIGALDPRRWETQGGATWRQRAGRILVGGVGAGVGGRSLCLAKQESPSPIYEVTVQVKLDDEAGAAGLAFAGDGKSRHYGFYPSGGRLRFVRFDGPDVYSWHVLDERASDAYLPGEWNRLKVHVENDRARCYVNGTLVYEHRLTDVGGSRIGLVKFRQTQADFRGFAVGKEVNEAEPTAEVVAAVKKLEAALPKHGRADVDLLAPLAGDSQPGALLLRERADSLERQAKQLRALAETLRRRGIVEELAGRLAKPDEKIDLLRCALLVAKLDNDEVDVDAYLDEVERMAGEIRDGLPKAATVDGKLAALNRYLYAERGFHGSRRDYYSRSNSYLNEVIDDREGLPITLAVLYIEIGRRLGLDLRGVGMPGHFLAAVVKDGGERQLLDPFEQGAKLAEADAVQRAVETTGRAPRPEHLEPVGKQAIVVRLIENLLGLATDEDHRPRMQGYLDVILKVDPQNLERRMLRAMVHYRNGSFDDALADVDYLLDHHRASLDEERVLEFRDRLERARREE